METSLSVQTCKSRLGGVGTAFSPAVANRGWAAPTRVCSLGRGGSFAKKMITMG